MAGWHTPTTVRQWWNSAPSNDELLAELLEVAKERVEVFTGVTPAADAVPANYRLGQVKITQALWESARANPAGNGDALGSEQYPLARTDMSAEVRRILRPPSATVRAK